MKGRGQVHYAEGARGGGGRWPGFLFVGLYRGRGRGSLAKVHLNEPSRNVGGREAGEGERQKCRKI